MKYIYTVNAFGFSMPPCKIDDEDYEYLSKWKWNFIQHASKGYYINNYNRSIHRTITEDIMKLDIPKGYHVHHIDSNGLNNQKSNLQIVTPKENRRAIPRDNYASKYFWVTFHKLTKSWMIFIKLKDICIQRSGFETEEMAVAARDYIILKENLDEKTSGIVLSDKNYKKMLNILFRTKKTSKYQYVSRLEVKRKRGICFIWRLSLQNKYLSCNLTFDTEKKALDKYNELIKQNNLDKKLKIQNWDGFTTKKDLMVKDYRFSTSNTKINLNNK